MASWLANEEVQLSWGGAPGGRPLCSKHGWLYPLNPAVEFLCDLNLSFGVLFFVCLLLFLFCFLVWFLFWLGGGLFLSLLLVFWF